MTRISHLHPICLALRLLLVAVCVWPFTGTRLLAISLGITPPAAFAGQAPLAPVNEEEENERAEDAKGRIGQRIEYRPDPPRITPRLQAVTPVLISPIRLTSTTCPAPVDPFCNGLGTPYRC